MPSLSYKPRFCEFVENGLQKPRPKGKRIKRQTIRRFRKNPIKVGDTLYHFYALRTKYCRKLGESICKVSCLIHIYFNKREIILPDAVLHTDAQLDTFARADGFKDFDDMKAFWIAEHGVKKGKRKVILRPFKGTLIKW
jgi:hypothetical protein